MPASFDLATILLRRDSPLCVAIAGGSGAGKTTLARALVAAAGESRALLLPSDAYYRDRSGLGQAERDRLNFDHPDALDWDRLRSDLEQLRRGAPVYLPVYDFATHRRKPESWRVEARALIVVDGVLLLGQAALRPLFDLAVYLHAPAELRLARRIERDVRERGRTGASVLRQFEATVRPMHARFVESSRPHADLELDTSTGADPLPPLLERLEQL